MLLTLLAERMFPQKLIEGLDMSNRLWGEFPGQVSASFLRGIRIAAGIRGLDPCTKI